MFLDDAFSRNTLEKYTDFCSIFTVSRLTIQIIQ